MRTPLISITFPSIYESGGVKVPLPRRMAVCTPDMKAALFKTAKDLRAAGGRLILSDLFRSYDMQLGSHLDWKSGKKRAFSPPPGGSLHEAGRGFDLDLGAMKITLADFWALAASNGIVPIVATPQKNQSEAWHFECRGSHALVQAYYKAGKGTNFDKPYQAMAASAIVSVGVKVDKFAAFTNGQDAAYIQSGLIRLGQVIGNMDGSIGKKTRDGCAALGIGTASVQDMLRGVDEALQEKFPGEYFDSIPSGTDLTI
jgi:hypothetical protein